MVIKTWYQLEVRERHAREAGGIALAGITWCSKTRSAKKATQAENKPSFHCSIAAAEPFGLSKAAAGRLCSMAMLLPQTLPVPGTAAAGRDPIPQPRVTFEVSYLKPPVLLARLGQAVARWAPPTPRNGDCGIGGTNHALAPQTPLPFLHYNRGRMRARYSP